ncbi:hypothetical protein BH23GEM6_BH23GEM6_21030 [soil metagenome]
MAPSRTADAASERFSSQGNDTLQLGVRVLTRIAGRDRITPQQSAADLVSRFLDATGSLPAPDVAALANVSEATIARWRRGGVSQLRRRTRERLQAVLLR